MKKIFIYLAITIILIALIYVRITGRVSFIPTLKSASKSISFEDKNSNGVWDDVEPFIKANAKNALQEKALEFEFQAFQKALLNPEIGKEIKNGDRSKDKLEQAWACMKKVLGVENAIAFETENSTEDAIVTTPARVRAYIEYNKNLSGGFYPAWEDENKGNPCPFEVPNQSEK